MKRNELEAIGIFDDSFEFHTVSALVKAGILERPIDGNHGEIHPKGEDFVSSGVPFLMASDIDNGVVDYHSCKFITAKRADGLRKGFAKNGDVLLTHKATIGRTAIVDYHAHPYVMLTPQVTYYRVRNKKRLSNRYLRLYFESSFFQSVLNLWAGSGATRAYLGITEQGKLPIVLPPFGKQQKLAAVLSAYDDLIENNRRRIALLERMAEQLYREWFVRFRFPGYHQAKFEKGRPVGWSSVPVAKAFRFTGGATPSKDTARYWKEGTINWFTPSDITAADGLFLGESGLRCTEEGLSSCSATLFPAYSVMMTSRATIGAIGINTTPACTNQGFIACLPNERYPLSYLYHWLKLSKDYFLSLCGGATFPELTKGTFKRIEVLTPPSSLVAEFDRRATPIFDSMEKLERANAVLAKSRDLLLPRLISGKLRVDDLDIQFPPSMQAEHA